jgi:hypothetical protein
LIHRVSLLVLIFAASGCARLFGWNIHAPGVLSRGFYRQVASQKNRVALYLEPALVSKVSHARGGKLADPTAYYLGEAFVPMLIEGFQGAFEEFVFLETPPSPEILQRYAIPYLVLVRLKDFGNRMTLKGQVLTLVTEAVILDERMNELERFESTGASDAKAVFKKRGGPEVNLNAALERNVLAVVQHVQDWIRGARGGV